MQLLADLEDSTRTYLGWPVYWVKEGAYIFGDQTGRSARGTAHYWNLMSPAIADYTFHSISDALRMMVGKLWEYDHLGETADIPPFRENELLDGAGAGITIESLDYPALDDKLAVIFPGYHGGNSLPVVRPSSRGYVPNGSGSQISCLRAMITIRRLALNA